MHFILLANEEKFFQKLQLIHPYLFILDFKENLMPFLNNLKYLHFFSLIDFISVILLNLINILYLR